MRGERVDGTAREAGVQWPDGIIPYKFDDKFNKTLTGFGDIVLAAMARWESQIGGGLVRFVPWQEGHDKWVLYKDGFNSSSADFIGAPRDKAKESKLWVGTTGGFIQYMPHELGHQMGLAHENERNARFYEDPKENPKKVVYDPTATKRP